jgi:hypothetical protein
LDWFKEIMGEHFDLKIMGRLGPDQGDEKSIRILNRVVEWGENETRHRADQRILRV